MYYRGGEVTSDAPPTPLVHLLHVRNAPVQYVRPPLWYIFSEGGYANSVWKQTPELVKPAVALTVGTKFIRQPDHGKTVISAVKGFIVKLVHELRLHGV